MRTFLLSAHGSPCRWLLIPATVVAAGAHIPLIGPHLTEAPYMGVLFIALTTTCAVLAAAATVRDSAAVYAASAAVCGLAILGYAATRIVALPMLADDVGNWFEPLGVLSIVSEAVVVTSALTALFTTPRQSRPSSERKISTGKRQSDPMADPNPVGVPSIRRVRPTGTVRRKS